LNKIKIKIAWEFVSIIDILVYKNPVKMEIEPCNTIKNAYTFKQILKLKDEDTFHFRFPSSIFSKKSLTKRSCIAACETYNQGQDGSVIMHP
jgi:hypothetical protein